MQGNAWVIWMIIIGIGSAVAYAIISTKKEESAKRERVVVKTQLLDKHTGPSTTRTSTASAVGRGIVGAAVAGPVGAIAGAVTAKQNTVGTEEYVFKVWWKDGTCTVEKCKYGDYWYNKFIAKM